MITTSLCDHGQHVECPGEGIVSGYHTPPHEPNGPQEGGWLHVTCECACHEADDLSNEERAVLQFMVKHKQLVFFDRLMAEGYVKYYPSGYEITPKGREAAAR